MPNLEYDVETNLTEISDHFMEWYQRLEPFGKSFPQAVLAIKNVVINEAISLKGGHLKLKIGQGGSVREALLFSPNDKQRMAVETGSCHLLVEPQFNYFAGKKRLQLLVQDIAPSL